MAAFTGNCGRKLGEFREALSLSKGNPERSLLNEIKVSRNVQRLRDEDLKPISPIAPNTLIKGDEIVQA